MYEKIKIFLVFVFSAILQISFLSNIFWDHISPDFVLILVIIISFRKSLKEFWGWVVIAGLILDFFSFGVIGLSSLIFIFIFLCVSVFTNRFFVSRKNMDFFVIFAIVIFGTIINYVAMDFINNLVAYLSNQEEFYSFINLNNRILGIKVLNNLVCLLIIYWPITKIGGIFGIEKNTLIVK